MVQEPTVPLASNADDNAPTWIDLTLRGRRDWAPDLASLTFDGWSSPFRPGQYCTLARTSDGEQIQRHYSIASAPGEPLELFLACVENGALSPCLFDLMPDMTIQAWSQPRGRFTLDRVPAGRDLWLIGTGTGLAPFLSMVRAGAPWPAFERVILIHTVRHVVDLGYRDEIEAIAAAQAARLVYLPTTSRDSVEGVLSGRVTHALDDGRIEAAAGVMLSAEHSQVMLCGNPAMLDDMRERLIARGLQLHRPHRPGQIHMEKYW